MPGEDPYPADELMIGAPDRKRPGVRSFRHLVIATAIVSATAGFAKGLASSSMTDAGFAHSGAIATFFIALAALAICIFVNAGDIVRAVKRVYSALILLGIVVVLASAFGADLVYLSIGKELLWMMFTCLMAYSAFKFGFPTIRAFGIGQAAYFAVSVSSWGLGMACASHVSNTSYLLTVTTVLVLAIVVAYTLVFTDADIKFIFTWRAGESAADRAALPDQRPVSAGAMASFPSSAPSSAAVPAAVPAGQVASACAPGAAVEAPIVANAFTIPAMMGDDQLLARIAAIPAACGVSEREKQIMALFARGHSANWIAEQLIISKNTVRTHIRSIYTKLDVHSRSELLEYLARIELAD